MQVPVQAGVLPRIPQLMARAAIVLKNNEGPDRDIYRAKELAEG